MADLDFKLVIEAITDSFDSAEKQVTGFFSSIEKNAQKLESTGKKLSLALTAPIALFAKASIDAFKQQEVAITKFTSSFEKNGDRIGQSFDELSGKAQAFSENSLFDDDDILGSVTSQLLNFQNVTSDIFDRAQQAVIDFAAKTGTSLEASATLVGKALQNPKEGLQQLVRSGAVAFTDVERQIIEGLDEVGRSAEAQQLILRRLEDQAGGFAAKLASTDTGKLDKLFLAFERLRESAGRAFIQILAPAIDILTRVLDEISKLDPAIQAIGAGFAILAAAIGPVVLVLPSLVAGFKLLQSSLLVIGGPAGVIVAIAAGLLIVAEKFNGFKNAGLSAAIVINEAFLKLLDTILSVPDAFSVLIPGLGLLKSGASAIRDVIAGNVASLNQALDENISKQQTELAEKNRLFGQKSAQSFTEGYIDELNSGKLGGEQAKAIQKANEDAAKAASAKRALDAKLFREREEELDRIAEAYQKQQEELGKLNETEQILSNSFASFFENMATGAETAGEAFKNLGRTIVQSLFSTALRNSLNSVFAGLFPGANLGGAATGGFVQAADGGHIRGPGTGTSDSILARLSNGEYVIRAASVKKFGVDFFSALNKGFMPNFNMGGYIENLRNNLSGVPRFADGGLVSAGTGNIQVNVINNSSQPVSAKSTRIADPRGAVINVVLEDLRDNGPISKQMQGAFKVSR